MLKKLCFAKARFNGHDLLSGVESLRSLVSYIGTYANKQAETKLKQRVTYAVKQLDKLIADIQVRAEGSESEQKKDSREEEWRREERMLGSGRGR